MQINARKRNLLCRFTGFGKLSGLASMHIFAIAAQFHMIAITGYLVENANCWIWYTSVFIAVTLEETLLQ